MLHFRTVVAITSGGPTDTKIYYQWGAHWYEILLPEGEKSMHIIKHPKKYVNLKNNFEVWL